MGLVIHKEKVTAELGEKLKSICPFGAISYDVSNGLSIGMGCKLCKLCVKKGEGIPGLNCSEKRTVSD